MDRFGLTRKVSKKLVHHLRWTTFSVRTGLNFGRMDRTLGLPPCHRHYHHHYHHHFLRFTIDKLVTLL